MPDFLTDARSLVEADAVLQLALQGTGIGVWHYNLAERLAWCSAGLRELLGYADEPTDVDLLARLHPDDAAAMRAAWLSLAAEQDERSEREVRVRHRDGSCRWVLVRGRVDRRSADGRAQRLTGVGIDITQRRHAEAEPDADHAMLRTAIEGLPHWVFWKDRHGVYRGCNAVFARFLRLKSSAAIVGLTDADLPWSKELAQAIRDTDEHVFREGMLCDELHDRVIGDRARPVLLSVAPLIDATGAISGLVGAVVDIGEASAIQRILKSDRERWSLAMAATGTIIWDSDFGTDTSFISPQMEKLLGFATGELHWNNQTFLERTHPDDRETVQRNGALIGSGAANAISFEHRLRRKDGTYIWLLLRSSIVAHDADGRPLRRIATHTDITERKQAEIAAEQSAQLLRTIIDVLPHGIFWKDHNGMYRGCNLAFARSMGASSPEELIERHDSQLPWTPARLQALLAVDAAVLRGERTFINEPQEEHLDHGVKYHLTTLLPLRNGASQIIGVIGLIIDITDLHCAQEAALLNEQRWKLALKCSGAGIWEINLQTGKAYRSPRVHEMLGYDVDEIDPMVGALDDNVHRDDWATVQAHREQVERGETDSIEIEHRLRCKDGSYRWILSRGAVLARDAAGRPAFLVGTFTDINDQYEYRDRAAQARKLESLGSLAAGVAHEINTPLQFVSDSVDFLRIGFDEIQRSAGGNCDTEIGALREQVPKALELVREGITRIANIVRAMSNYSHPDACAKESTNVADLLRTALALAHHEYKYVADVRTEFADLPPLACHAGELSQVFINLIVNAAHAIADVCPDGSARGLISVRTRQQGAAIVVEIEDTGCGIPAANMDRIFDPFFTTKPIGRGTGQGLSLARKIVEQGHSGGIEVDSQAGRGTLVRVVLPLDAPETQVAA
jgi:two-component system, NtrC family, sensor kinase